MWLIKLYNIGFNIAKAKDKEKNEELKEEIVKSNDLNKLYKSYCALEMFIHQ